MIAILNFRLNRFLQNLILSFRNGVFSKHRDRVELNLLLLCMLLKGCHQSLLSRRQNNIQYGKTEYLFHIFQKAACCMLVSRYQRQVRQHIAKKDFKIPRRDYNLNFLQRKLKYREYSLNSIS